MDKRQLILMTIIVIVIGILANLVSSLVLFSMGVQTAIIIAGVLLLFLALILLLQNQKSIIGVAARVLTLIPRFRSSDILRTLSSDARSSIWQWVGAILGVLAILLSIATFISPSLIGVPSPPPTPTPDPTLQVCGSGQVSVELNQALTVREGPGTGYRAIARLVSGTGIIMMCQESTSDNEAWVRVLIQDQNARHVIEGWVLKQYITIGQSD